MLKFLKLFRKCFLLSLLALVVVLLIDVTTITLMFNFNANVSASTSSTMTVSTQSLFNHRSFWAINESVSGLNTIFLICSVQTVVLLIVSFDGEINQRKDFSTNEKKELLVSDDCYSCFALNNGNLQLRI